MSSGIARTPPPRLRRRGATLLDAYVVVDWSARSGPSGRAPCADAIWVAEARWASTALRWERERYFRTRRECVEHLVATLARHVACGRKALAAFDFPLGYPAGLARALRLAPPSWRATWRLLRDPRAGLRGGPESAYATPTNANNRFEVAAALNRAAGGGGAPGPFHGCPARHACASLPRARPAFPFAARGGVRLAYLRIAEERLRRAGRVPLSPWWVLGGGAPTAGGQALVGIPAVAELAERLGGAAVAWPFETGFGAAAAVGSAGGRVLIAEIWPGLVADPLAPGLVRDAAQVRGAVAWAAAADASGALAALLERPAGLDASEVATCVDEEGWILGVG